jgi:hypothetical protein
MVTRAKPLRFPQPFGDAVRAVASAAGFRVRCVPCCASGRHKKAVTGSGALRTVTASCFAHTTPVSPRGDGTYGVRSWLTIR